MGRATRTARIVAAAIAVLVMVVLVFAILAASNLAFSLFDRLQSYSPWLALAYAGALAVAAALSGLFIWRILAPAGTDGKAADSAPPDEQTLREDISRYEEQGVDVGEAQAELQELVQRRQAGEVYVALFGEISHGKSSLIRALVPQAEAPVDVRGGTTRGVERYTWQSPSGDRLILADVPGMNLAGDAGQGSARQEALRAHLVVFVCDGDLTQAQWSLLGELRRFGKPLIVAINKKDQYSQEDLELIRNRIARRVGSTTPVVAIQSGGVEQVVRVMPDGSEERVERPRPADVHELTTALQALLLERSDQLDSLRDRSVFLLAADKLEGALVVHRAETAQLMIDRYTRRAVVGGLAAFAPGSDLVIQGALATALARAMTQLYGARVRDVDLDRLIKAMSRTVGRTMPLLLAVVGNALKAFPGVGTVAGGVAHAVAYGLIFQSFGKALMVTLNQHHALKQKTALAVFEEDLSGDLASRARQLAALALSQRAGRAGTGTGTGGKRD